MLERPSSWMGFHDLGNSNADAFGKLAVVIDDRDAGGDSTVLYMDADVFRFYNGTYGDVIRLTKPGASMVGNTSDLYSAKIQTNGNIHAQGAVTSEIYLQMATASTPAAATGFVRMWFDGTNIKVILPGGTTRTLNWT